MKFLPVKAVLFVALFAASMLQADELEQYTILITAHAEYGSWCRAKDGCESLTDEQLADRLSEQLVLTLYRFEKSGIELGHQYAQKSSAFLYKKDSELKGVCSAEKIDAILSMSVEGGEDYITKDKRDLVLRWFDCSSEESWRESMNVDAGTSGWKFQQQFYKYLDVVFPYFLG